MTIIVTGGAGFIGSNFIFHMLEKYPDYRIICLDKLTYAGNLSTLAPVMANPNFRFVKEDICDREEVFQLFEEEHPDIVVNFAAESHVDRSIENPGVFLQTNIIGTQVLMDACRKYMKAMIDIAFTGKCEVSNAADCYKLNNKVASVLYLNVSPGTIVKIHNEDVIKNNPAVIAYLPRCKVDDTISWSYNVNQRFAELDILTETFEELVETMDEIQKNIFVEDENGENMIFNLFDLTRIER